MDFKKLKEMAGNPKFISGIYNYCDRWCERCTMTARCLNFAMLDEDDREHPESRDMTNQAFWDRLHTVFRQTIEMVREDAAERGIDLEMTPEETKAFEAEERRRDRQARNHGAARAAKKYGKMADDWLKSHEDLFGEKGKQLESEWLMGVQGRHPDAEAASIADAVEVIRWHQHQIWVKLMRSLHSADEDDLLDDDGRPFPRDSDGSAKVALIAIDRSIGAWGTLRNSLPDEADSALDILVHLTRLRRRVEKVFPNARAFIRPGFDEPVVARPRAGVEL